MQNLPHHMTAHRERDGESDTQNTEYFKMRTIGVAGHSRDGGVGHTLQAPIIISVRRDKSQLLNINCEQ